MLRMALIASLILFNFSVWVGPAEVLAARGKAMLDSSPRHEDAERFIMEGDIASAAALYQALLQAEPENVALHTEYGLLWLNNGATLQHALGWSREKMLMTVVEQFRKARDFSPGDFSMATQYAMTLMDTEFFGNDIPIEHIIEAWNEVLTIVRQENALVPQWNRHPQVEAHTFLQMARTEFRYGRKAEMEKYIEQALAKNPKLRIPKDLLEM